MKKSNVDDLIFTHQQASRLVNLFATSFDACLDEASNNSPGQPVCWQPTLTDIHQQVVHAITPVRVQQMPGHSPPTLQLTLLGVPEQPQQLVTGQMQTPVEAVLPATKHAL